MGKNNNQPPKQRSRSTNRGTKPKSTALVKSKPGDDTGAEHHAPIPVDSLPRKIANDIAALAGGETHQDLCDKFLFGVVDKNSILAWSSIMESTRGEPDRRRLMSNLTRSGINFKSAADFVNLSAEPDVPVYKETLRTLELTVKDLVACKTFLHFLLKRFREKLQENYRALSNELEEQFTAKNIDVVQQMQQLVDAGIEITESRDLIGIVKAIIRGVAGVISARFRKEAYVSTVREAIRAQLDPAAIAGLGLTLNTISEDYSRAARGGKLPIEEQLAIYHLVKAFFKSDRPTVVRGLLEKYNLLGYAKIHGNVMEYNLRLQFALKTS